MSFIYFLVATVLLVMGAISLAKGRIGLKSVGIVRGRAARWIGVFLVLPLPLMLALHTVTVSVAVAKGWGVRPSVVQMADGILLGLCVAAALIGFVTSEKHLSNSSGNGEL
jgi:hypothetical protein